MILKVSLLQLRRALLLILTLALLCGGVFSASAVVDANSLSNTNPPSDGAPWQNVGQIGAGASGVYLGGGWVLTADHVGVGTIVLSGASYAPDGKFLQLTNSDGSLMDLIMFHLAAAPPLPSLPLVSNTPAAFSQVDLIGYGLIAGSAQTNLGVYSGFYWSAAQFKSWGNNKINLGGVTTINIGYGNVSVFAMDFTAPGTLGPTAQTSDEGQVAPGDSGGGVFVKNGSFWQLAGISDAEGTQVNQPSGTSAYGDKTYATDIATYRSEIVGVLAASPVPPLSIRPSGNNVLISWADTGVSYTLQASSSFSAQSWVILSATQSSTNGQVSVLVPDTGSFRLFRLQKP